MLTFNTLLKVNGFEPGAVRLVRHADTRRRSDGRLVQSLLIEALRNDLPAFEFYQRIQASEVYRDGQFLCSFIAMPNARTTFAGLWQIDGVVPNQDRQRCRLTEEDGADRLLYTLTKVGALDEFIGRLAIEWGPGTRAWVQRADLQDKRVLSISDPADPPFPGWSAFRSTIDNVPALPASWQAILSITRGVYLLVHRPSGLQYVGSATGEQGFLARWLTYAATDHGGNVNLKGKSAADFDVGVLEAAASSATDAEVLAAETFWKLKLGTRALGLNAN